MNESEMSKQEIALELTLDAFNKTTPRITDYSPEGIGEAVATLYHTILENIKE